MSVNLSIKGVPDDTAERLRQRAERNHRSLQGELMVIIEQAAAAVEVRSPAVTAVARRPLPSCAKVGRRSRTWWPSA